VSVTDSTRPRVFVTRQISAEALGRIRATADTEVWPDELPPSYDILRDKACGVDGLLTMLSDRIDASLMDAAPNLRVVSNYAVGFDNIDIAEATRRGIIVGNTPGVLTETTADLAFALLMAAARRLVEADGYTRKGLWKTWGPGILLGQDIHHATLGIVGLGRIGTEVARRAKGFGMQVLHHSRSRHNEVEQDLGIGYVPELNGLLESSDFISLHVPLTAETRHMISTEQFAMMKPDAVLVNTSRGAIIDQIALYQALKTHQIFAAAIDVTDVEPMPPDDPLLTLDNIIITPHIGSASFTTRREMAIMAANNLLTGLRGEVPPHCVNPEALNRQIMKR
jgi:glyoxylate reductase